MTAARSDLMALAREAVAQYRGMGDKVIYSGEHAVVLGSTAHRDRFPSSTSAAASCRGSAPRRAEQPADPTRIRCDAGPAGPVFVCICSGYSGLAVGEERDKSRGSTGG